MTKIGFKMSWELKNEKKRTRKKVTQEEEMPMIIPGTGMAHILNLSMKIQEFEDYIKSAAFTRLSKNKKAEMLDTYRFFVTTLALIQPQSSGVADISNLSEIGFLK